MSRCFGGGAPADEGRAGALFSGAETWEQLSFEIPCGVSGINLPGYGGAFPGARVRACVGRARVATHAMFGVPQSGLRAPSMLPNDQRMRRVCPRSARC